LNFPSSQIEDIKIAYDYNYLISLNNKLITAADNLDICKFIKAHKQREVMVLESGFLGQIFFFCCSFKKICGSKLYEAEVNKYKTAIAEELNRLPKKILPIAFVTFKNERDAIMYV
ncbi:CSC1-like protein 1, partial [Nephila pilipes]